MTWLIILGGLGLVTLVVTWWRLRKRRHRRKLHGPIALLGPLIAPESRPLPRPNLTRGYNLDRSRAATPPHDPFQPLVVNQPSFAPQASYAPPPPAPEVVASSAAPRGNGNGNGDGPSDGTQRYTKPIDGTLQFLPGRFEVVAGRGLGAEIRFVRTGGPDGSSVTFGRAEGPEYRHVQLDAPTVSRRHASMRWDGARWSLTNLSATNPVAINGVALPGEGTAIDLADGDRVEMGEITFRFHAQ
ncbi:MAG: FHA domain-containing protein [Gemmatimonadota bacterium]